MSEQGIADLYRRYAPAIYAHCRRLLSSPAAARDALQESFVRVLQHHRTLGPEDQALRYLYRTSTNLCINLIRQQAVRERAAPEIGNRARAIEVSQPSPGDRQFVQRLLDRCDRTATEIALMHFVDGLPQVQVAAALGISRRTVFNRIKQIERIAADLLDAAPTPAPVGAASGQIF
jgi:RNA polymerase sigma-70 factor (ECF subfamily)